MPGPEPDLTIHDIQKREQVVFSPSGAIGTQVQVTFFIGEHGPFFRTYAKAEASSDKVRADIEHEAVELRRLLTGS